MRRNKSLYHGNEKRVTYNWVCIIICKKATCDYVDHSLYHPNENTKHVIGVAHICNELSLHEPANIRVCDHRDASDWVDNLVVYLYRCSTNMVCESYTGYTNHRDAGKKWLRLIISRCMYRLHGLAKYLDACTDWACETFSCKCRQGMRII